MVTLEQVKEFLSIDYTDHDSKIMLLLSGEVRRAEKITGRNYTNAQASDYEEMSKNVESAVIRGVATSFTQGDDIGADGSATESINASIYTYRQECTNPMF